jgi:hypothetical protein
VVDRGLFFLFHLMLILKVGFFCFLGALFLVDMGVGGVLLRDELLRKLSLGLVCVLVLAHYVFRVVQLFFSAFFIIFFFELGLEVHLLVDLVRQLVLTSCARRVLDHVLVDLLS